MPAPRAFNNGGRISRVARESRARQEARGVVEELGAARRESVYRTDVAFEGVDVTYKKADTPETRERIAEMRAARYTLQAIGAALGIHPGTVHSICRRHGITKGERK